MLTCMPRSSSMWFEPSGSAGLNCVWMLRRMTSVAQRKLRTTNQCSFGPPPPLPAFRKTRLTVHTPLPPPLPVLFHSALSLSLVPFIYPWVIWRRSGRLLAGGEPDFHSVAVNIINDYQRGKLPYFVAPPLAEGETPKSVAAEPTVKARFDDHIKAAAAAVVTGNDEDGKGEVVTAPLSCVQLYGCSGVFRPVMLCFVGAELWNIAFVFSDRVVRMYYPWYVDLYIVQWHRHDFVLAVPVLLYSLDVLCAGDFRLRYCTASYVFVDYFSVFSGRFC